jgi:ATP-independent RNA helicase DbpA
LILIKLGQKVTDSKQSFSCLPLREALLKNLSSLSYEIMTPVQSQSLPIMLSGEDVIVQAKTGSGKTAAFGLSLLNQLKVENFAVQALILCPTRELAEQVSQALRRLARLMHNVKILNLSGGIPIRPQSDSLRHGAHIIVGTPGRVQKHLDKAALSLNSLQTLVLDEADRMLDMGFFDDIKAIISACPKQRQTLLFSATYPAGIKQLGKQFMQNAKEVIVEGVHTAHDIEQRFYNVQNQAGKIPLLKALLLHYKPRSTLIFCNTKQQTAALSDRLIKAGFHSLAINGDMEQKDRDQVIVRFKNQSCSILVATDVAARGLDIQELPAVINFDLAFTHDVHIHRIGRTGRAGHKGLALSLITAADAEVVCAIESHLGYPLIFGEMNELSDNNTSIFQPEMVTIGLDAGRKDKIRPSDILGALTKDAGLSADAIGKIDVTEIYSYVAIHVSQVDRVYKYLQNGKIKGRKLNAKKFRQ